MEAVHHADSGAQYGPPSQKKRAPSRRWEANSAKLHLSKEIVGARRQPKRQEFFLLAVMLSNPVTS